MVSPVNGRRNGAAEIHDRPVRTRAEAELHVEMNKVPDPEEVERRIADNHQKWIAQYGAQVECRFALAERINDPRLVNEAERSRRADQQGIDKLLRELSKGNMNPGIGSKHLFAEVQEARGRRGARVYFRNTAEGAEIVGLSTKANQSRVIDRLQEIYG